MVKAQLPTAPGGRFAKDQFRLDLQAGTVTCPARVTVAIRPAGRGGGRARFGVACSVCPLRQACTSNARGRVVAIHPREAELAAARVRQRDPAWLADYRATRPKVERKLATCSAAATVAGAPACAGWSVWPKTSGCWPLRSTWLGSPPSVCGTPAPAGRYSQPEQTATRPPPGPAQPAEHAQAVREQRPPRAARRGRSAGAGPR